jgi:hypothetical protein
LRSCFDSRLTRCASRKTSSAAFIMSSLALAHRANHVGGRQRSPDPLQLLLIFTGFHSDRDYGRKRLGE